VGQIRAEAPASRNLQRVSAWHALRHGECSSVPKGLPRLQFEQGNIKAQTQEGTAVTHFTMPGDPTPRVLIVEADLDTLDLLASCLRGHGYEVEGACDEEAGLDSLRERGVPSLLLLDLNLPGIDGWDFLDAVVSEPAWCAVPVIVLTGDPEVSQQEASALGVDGVLLKPVDADVLLAAVGRCCDAGCVTA